MTWLRRSVWLLALIIVIAWPISYLRPVALTMPYAGLGMIRGVISAWACSVPLDSTTAFDWGIRGSTGPNAFRAAPGSRWLPTRGLAGIRSGSGPTIPMNHWFVPTYVIALPLFGVALAPLLFRRRPAAGCCRTCGYDLTGNVSGRCPECGVAR